MVENSPGLNFRLDDLSGEATRALPRPIHSVANRLGSFEQFTKVGGTWMRIQAVTLFLVAFAGCDSSSPVNTQQHNDAGSSDAGSQSDVDCRGPGRYESGKEGSYRPCCSGLTEVSYQQAAYDINGVPGCWSPPLRIYACVRGTCGDGICEIGEAPACGCVADCPDAAWGPQDAGAPK
jgi:hypothetical protein